MRWPLQPLSWPSTSTMPKLTCRRNPSQPQPSRGSMWPESSLSQRSPFRTSCAYIRHMYMGFMTTVLGRQDLFCAKHCVAVMMMARCSAKGNVIPGIQTLFPDICVKYGLFCVSLGMPFFACIELPTAWTTLRQLCLRKAPVLCTA